MEPNSKSYQPLRLAFFVHRFPQVSEAFIINQADALLQRRHSVDVFSIWGLSPEPAEKLRETFPIAARSGLLSRCYEPEFEVAWNARCSRALELVLTKFHDRFDVLSRALNPLRYGRSALNLRLLYEAAMLDGHAPFDVVHCQFADLAPVVLRLRDCGALRAPVVVHIRGIDITRRPLEMGGAAYRRIFAGADLLLANCDYFRNKAIGLGCPPEKIVVYRSGIDLSEFRYRGSRPRTNGGLRLALVGRMTEKKGIAYALQAMAELAKRRVDAHLSVLGDGPLRADLEQQVRDLGISSRVEFLGAGGHDDVRRLLAASDLLLAPSVTARDGDEDAPVNTLKEGMATGLPVVATRHGGIPELVIDRRTGRLVPERNAAAIADAVQWLVAHRDEWDAMGRVGRRIIERDYDLNRQTQRLIALDRALVSNRGSARLPLAAAAAGLLAS